MSTNKSRVAAVQMVSTADIHANIEAAGRLIAEAAGAARYRPGGRHHSIVDASAMCR